MNFSGMLAVGLDKDIVFGPPDRPNFTWNMFGSPVNAGVFNAYLEDNKMRLTSSSVNSGDFVGQGLGGNHELYVYGKQGQTFNVVHHYATASNTFQTIPVKAVALEQTQNQNGAGNFLKLFARDGSSPHSNYSCVTRCGAEPPRITLPSVNQE